MPATLASRVSSWLVGTIVSVDAANQHARVITLDVPGWLGSNRDSTWTCG